MAGAKQTKREGHGGLPDKLVMSVGMKVMVTFNVATDLDIANGSRGEIKAIILDDREQVLSRTDTIVTLSYLPVYVLIKSQNTKVPTLPGLDNGVIPLTPLQRTFTIPDGNTKKTVTRKLFPFTASYAFTDYRSQGQTINNAIVDIALPPTGFRGITLFNIYVALSRCRGRSSIRLLRDFNEKLLMSHPSEFLRLEDERLAKLDKDTLARLNSCEEDAHSVDNVM